MPRKATPKLVSETLAPAVAQGAATAVDFPRKLRLVMRVLGCGTQKELFARLETVNPNTGYRPDRAYKWIQGKATPRDLSIYDDIAQALDMGLDGETLRRCTYAEFARRVVDPVGEQPPPRDALQKEATTAAVTDTSILPARSVGNYLAGRYFALSRAWSAYRPNTLIAAVVTIRQIEPAGLEMEYVESLPGGDLRLRGRLERYGRSFHVLLTSEDGEFLITTVFGFPTPPAAVLAGVMSGMPLHDAEPRPVSGRLICVRVPDELEQTPIWSGYLEPHHSPVTSALVDIGVDTEIAKQLAPELLSVITMADDNGLIDVKTSVLNTMMAPVLKPMTPAPPTPRAPRSKKPTV